MLWALLAPRFVFEFFFLDSSRFDCASDLVPVNHGHADRLAA